jgi:hypothetical protein
VVDGMGAQVSCTVAPHDSGFDLSAEIDAPNLETNAAGVVFQQQFSLHATYPATTPHASGATASISSTDTNTQSLRADESCVLDVISLGNGTGGALFATFNCSSFTDSNDPDTACRLTGTIVLENCYK